MSPLVRVNLAGEEGEGSRGDSRLNEAVEAGIGEAGSVCRLDGDEAKMGRLGGREGGGDIVRADSSSFGIDRKALYCAGAELIGASLLKTCTSLTSGGSSKVLLVTLQVDSPTDSSLSSRPRGRSKLFIAVTALNTADETFGGGAGSEDFCFDQEDFDNAFLTTSAGSSSASLRAFSRS